MIKTSALLALAGLLFLTACSAGHSGKSGLPDQSGDFELSIFPETYSFGGSARAISLRQYSDYDSIELQLLAESASGLQALFFSLSYDPARFSPAGVMVSDCFAAPDQRLDLTIRAEPGRLEHGSILLHAQPPTGRQGFSGKAVLARLRFDRRPDRALREVSAPPDSSAAWSPLYSNGSPGNLLWFLANPGDYDQNGVVAVQDLTPIGINFGAAVPAGPGPDGRDYGSALDVIDGSNDGLINVQDLTTIGVNYGRRVAGFNLYSSASGGDYPLDNSAPSTIAPFNSVDIGFSATNTAQQRRAYDYTEPSPPAGPLFWVRPYDSDGSEGTPTEIYDSGSPNQAPVISGFAVEPAQGMPGRVSQLTAQASDADGDSLMFSWSIISGAGTLLRDEAGYGVYNGYFAPDHNETATLRLTADDGHGGTDTFDGQVLVNTSFEGSFRLNPVQVHGWVEASGEHSALTGGIDGLPRIFYYNENAIDGDGVYFALAGNPFGDSWSVVGRVGDGGSRGLAAWSFYTQSGYATYDSPGGAGNLVWFFQDAPFSLDFNRYVLDSSPQTGLFPSISYLDNQAEVVQPAICYHNDLGPGTGSLRFIAGSDYLNGQWQAPKALAGEPESAGVDLGGESSIALVNGNPAIAYHDTGGQRLLYVRAGDPDGSSWNAPLPAVVHDEAGVLELGASPALVTLPDGRPGIFYKRKSSGFGSTELLFKAASDANGLSWYPAANYINLVNPNSRISAGRADGWPAVAYCLPVDVGGSCNLSQLNAIDAAGMVSYDNQLACSLAGSNFINPSLAFIGGRAAVSVHDQTMQDLYFNIRY